MPGFDNLAIFLGLGPLNLRKEYTIAKLLDQHNFTLLSKPYSYIHKKLTYHSSAKKVLFTVNGENSRKSLLETCRDQQTRAHLVFHIHLIHSSYIYGSRNTWKRE